LKVTNFKWLIVLVLMTFVAETGQAYSKKTDKEPGPEEVRSTMFLKQYMAEFGTLVAGMEILRFKEKKPDWAAIEITIQQMDQTIQKLKAADQAGNYKEFTDILDQNLQDVKKYGKAKDKRVFDSFDKLTDGCFKCHAAHRPSDFPLPPKQSPKISQGDQKLLFQP
jgi:hypothetical protein